MASSKKPPSLTLKEASEPSPRERVTPTISLAKIPKTGELIARELRRRIVRGELQEGSTLPSESDLMAQLSVSRASLREALRVLESESLLTVKRGSRGGPIVHRPTPAIAAKYFGLVLQAEGTLLQDVYAARLLIEPPMVRLVVRNAKGRAPASLQNIIAQEHKALDKGDIQAAGSLIVRFHGTLIELSRNKTMLLIMKMLDILYEQHIAAINSLGASFDQLKASRLSVRAQGKLIDYIASGNEESAVSYWRTHLLKVREYLFAMDDGQRLIDVI